MNAPQHLARWRLRWWIAAAIALGGLTSWLGWDMEHLLLGWIYFPLHTLPQMTVDWPSLAVGLVGLALFVVLLHVTLSWFAANGSFAPGHQGWCWRSSLVIAGMLLLMFLSGISLVGATHQLIWMQTGRAGRAQSEPPVGIISLARDEANRLQVENNLTQFGFGLQTQHDTFQSLPPGGTMTEEGEMLHGWAIMSIYGLNYYSEEIDYGIPWNKPPNDRIFKCNLNEFVNPALRGPYFDEKGFGLAHVAGNVHVLPIRKLPARRLGDGNFRNSLKVSGQVMTFADIKDGASHTLYVGTVTENFKPWGHPANVRDPGRGINKSPDGFGGPPGWKGAAFVFCDGSVRQLSEKIDPRVLRQLATPAGGEKGAELDRLGKE